MFVDRFQSLTVAKVTMISVDRIGFTGTQAGLTSAQQISLIDLLSGFYMTGTEWIHLGDCVGADHEAHMIAVMVGLKTFGHPPVIRSKRVFCKYDSEVSPKDYILRNHDIVDMSQHLIGCPQYMHSQLHSGTWSTIRYAVKRCKPITIVYPDGTIKDQMP